MATKKELEKLKKEYDQVEKAWIMGGNWCIEPKKRKEYQNHIERKYNVQLKDGEWSVARWDMTCYKCNYFVTMKKWPSRKHKKSCGSKEAVQLLEDRISSLKRHHKTTTKTKSPEKEGEKDGEVTDADSPSAMEIDDVVDEMADAALGAAERVELYDENMSAEIKKMERAHLKNKRMLSYGDRGSSGESSAGGSFVSNKVSFGKLRPLGVIKKLGT